MIQKTIVIEFGSVYIRCGLAGEDCPRFIINSQILNNIIKDTKESLIIKLTDLLQRIFLETLQVKAKDFSVLIIEKFHFVKLFRDTLLTILLKDFQIISVSFQPDLHMGILAGGCPSGVILNIGESESQVICFSQFRPLIQTYKTSSIGVSHAAESFNFLLEYQLEKKLSVADTRPFFERVNIAVTDSLKDSIKDIEVFAQKNINNEVFILKKETRSECLESLFKGETEKDGCVNEDGGLVGLLFSSLKLCSSDIRYSCMKHIIICGGGAMIPGLPVTLCEVATKLGKTDPFYMSTFSHMIDKLPNQLISPIPSPFLRSSLCWIGGSLFASIQSNFKRFITLQDVIDKKKESNNIIEKEKNEEKKIIELFTAPDWLSLDYHDWIFSSPSFISSNTVISLINSNNNGSNSNLHGTLHNRKLGTPMKRHPDASPFKSPLAKNSNI